MAQRPQNLMEMIAGQIASGQQKYPRPNRQAKGSSGAYYQKLGADIGDNTGAAQAFSKAQRVYREGGAMPDALRKLIEQSGGSTKTTPMLPSQLPAAVAEREKARLGRGAAGGKTVQDKPPGVGGGAAMPPAGYKAPMSQEVPAGPKAQADPAMAQAMAAVQGGPLTFKGTKAPMQEDIDAVNALDGAEYDQAYAAFEAKFGPDMAAQFLDTGDDD
jgi:hypothetical protein